MSEKSPFLELPKTDPEGKPIKWLLCFEGGEAHYSTNDVTLAQFLKDRYKEWKKPINPSKYYPNLTKFFEEIENGVDKD